MKKQNTLKILLFITLLLITLTSATALSAKIMFADSNTTKTINPGDSLNYYVRVVSDQDFSFTEVSVRLIDFTNGNYNDLGELEYNLTTNKFFYPPAYTLKPADYANLSGNYFLELKAEQTLNGNVFVESAIAYVYVSGTRNSNPNKPVVSLNSSSGKNITSDDLICSAKLIDPDGDSMNVTVQWFKNDVLYSEHQFNNNYPSQTDFQATLNSSNTNVGDEWFCSLNISDGTGNTISNSAKIKILANPANVAPIFTSTPIIKVELGKTYVYDVNATDADNDTLTYGLSSGPSGMSMDSQSGIITWTPTLNDLGQNPVIITVTDNINVPVTQSFSINVSKKVTSNSPPVFTTTQSKTTIFVGDTFVYDANATDADNDTLTYGLSFGPSGMSMDSQSGIITWIPTSDDVGTNVITIFVTDGINANVVQSFILNVQKKQLIIDDFNCNKDITGDGISDVTQGGTLSCSAHIQENISGVTLSFSYTGTDNFLTCTTNFKGYCSSDIVATDNPGQYSVSVTAQKTGWTDATAGPVPIEIFKQGYEIRNLKIFEDEFVTEQDTFYRKTPMYVSFDVYDSITGQKISPDSDPNVLQFVYLKVNGAPVDFNKWSDPITLKYLNKQQESSFIDKTIRKIKHILGIQSEGDYKFELSEIPISDDFLGYGKVFAFTFNFSDETSGELTKDVNILNNEVNFNLPSETQITPGGTIVLNLNDYTKDVETPLSEMIYTYTVNEDALQITQTKNLIRIKALPKYKGTEIIFFSANDTDGSVITKSIKIKTNGLLKNKAPTAIIDMPAKVEKGTMVNIDGSRSFDEDGTIKNYYWNIRVGGKTIFTNKGDSSIKYNFTKRAIYTVNLIVTDNKGKTGTATKNIETTDNQNNGNDLDDETGLLVTQFDIMGTDYGTIALDEPYEVYVSLKNNRQETLRHVKVTFSLPELAYQISANSFNINANGGRKSVSIGDVLPFTREDIPPGEYIALVTVKAGNILRTKYFPLYIE